MKDKREISAQGRGEDCLQWGALLVSSLVWNNRDEFIHLNWPTTLSLFFSFLFFFSVYFGVYLNVKGEIHKFQSHYRWRSCCGRTTGDLNQNMVKLVRHGDAVQTNRASCLRELNNMLMFAELKVELQSFFIVLSSLPSAKLQGNINPERLSGPCLPCPFWWGWCIVNYWARWQQHV